MIATTAQAHDTPSLWARLTYRGPSIDVLHETYAKRRRTDPDAPVYATHQIVIDAPVDRVWEVLGRPEGWAAVDPSIRNVRLEGGVVEDARFKWRNGKTKLSSRFAVVDPHHELSWTGTAMGSNAVHRHVLEPTSDGRTRLLTEESMTGFLVVLFFSRAKLRSGLEQWLSAVAAAAVSPGQVTDSQR